MNLPTGAWSSIRIPVVPKGIAYSGITFGDDDVTMREFVKVLFFTHLRIGLVKRVDIVTTDIDTQTQTSLYIHFEYWLNSPEARDLRATMDAPGSRFRLSGTKRADGTVVPFYILRDGVRVPAYLPFNINLAPVPEYTGPLNIHQLWAKVCYYEEQEKLRLAAEEAAEKEKEDCYAVANAYFDALRAEEETKGVYTREFPLDYPDMREQ